MCWSKSHIPLVIWQVGDSTSNVIESLHADVNREGKYCTLLGGVKKGQWYDSLKMQMLKVINASISYANSNCLIDHGTHGDTSLIPAWPHVCEFHPKPQMKMYLYLICISF